MFDYEFAGEEKRKLYDAMMIKENREILDSLNSMNKELTSMAANLRSKISTVNIIKPSSL